MKHHEKAVEPKAALDAHEASNVLLAEAQEKAPHAKKIHAGKTSDAHANAEIADELTKDIYGNKHKSPFRSIALALGKIEHNPLSKSSVLAAVVKPVFEQFNAHAISTLIDRALPHGFDLATGSDKVAKTPAQYKDDIKAFLDITQKLNNQSKNLN